MKVPTVTIAFEDLFGRARAGDADYNDFLASYDISETMDEEGRVLRIDVEARAVRKWAGHNHAFDMDRFLRGDRGPLRRAGGPDGPGAPSNGRSGCPLRFPRSRGALPRSARPQRFTLESEVPQNVAQPPPGGSGNGRFGRSLETALQPLPLLSTTPSTTSTS
ncbi:MAG: hypothetical protein M0C28_37625 [Candidatus Moduliflexus flocculans]|nr:hypothetical protein [Candidatus Moduliflexus flocculans]